MTNPDLSTEALMARRKLAEQATPGGWSAITRADINGCLVCDIIDERGVELADSLTQEAASHIVSNDPSTVIATIDELLRLREQVEALTNTRAVQLQEMAVDMLNEVIHDKTGEDIKAFSLGATCPHCNMQFATMREAIEHDAACPKHPATIRAERLEKEADWLAENCWKKTGCEYIPTKDERGGMWCDECPHEHDCRKCWREAAGRAVEEKL